MKGSIIVKIVIIAINVIIVMIAVEAVVVIMLP